MNKNAILIATGVLFFVVVLTSVTKTPESIEPLQTDTMPAVVQDTTPRKGNCLADDCLAVADLDFPVEELDLGVVAALTSALDDEYKAYATYDAVINAHGSTRPFSMIIRAEEQHISSLKSIFDKYGLQIPENSYVGTIEAPASVSEACSIGVQAEIDNAALYRNELLPVVSAYEDITLVFNNLMNASQEKHLPAFERCSN